LNELINRQIINLDLSIEIKSIFQVAGFVYLKQLLEKSPEELMDIPGLTLRHLSEYKRFIIKHGLQVLQKDF